MVIIDTLFSESLCGLNACAGLGGQFVILDMGLRISSALEGEDVGLVMQIGEKGTGGLLLCVSVPVHVY